MEKMSPQPDRRPVTPDLLFLLVIQSQTPVANARERLPAHVVLCIKTFSLGHWRAAIGHGCCLAFCRAKRKIQQKSAVGNLIGPSSLEIETGCKKVEGKMLEELLLFSAAAKVTTIRELSLALTWASVLLHPHGYTPLPAFDVTGGRLRYC